MNTPPTKAPFSFWLTTLTMSLIPLIPPAPKLAIKTNFACREIKPSLAEGWHQLPSIPLCFLCSAFYYYHSFFPTFSLANGSIQHGYMLRADPHLPLIADEYAAVKKIAPTIWILLSTGHSYVWVHDPHFKFNSQAL